MSSEYELLRGENSVIEINGNFICLGRQTKQIMVGKFQSLMLLIANA
jgi:hypothetical protein